MQNTAFNPLKPKYNISILPLLSVILYIDNEQTFLYFYGRGGFPPPFSYQLSDNFYQSFYEVYHRSK